MYQPWPLPSVSPSFPFKTEKYIAQYPSASFSIATILVDLIADPTWVIFCTMLTLFHSRTNWLIETKSLPHAYIYSSGSLRSWHNYPQQRRTSSSPHRLPKRPWSYVYPQAAKSPAQAMSWYYGLASKETKGRPRSSKKEEEANNNPMPSTGLQKGQLSIAINTLAAGQQLTLGTTWLIGEAG